MNSCESTTSAATICNAKNCKLATAEAVAVVTVELESDAIGAELAAKMPSTMSSATSTSSSSPIASAKSQSTSVVNQIRCFNDEATAAVAIDSSPKIVAAAVANSRCSPPPPQSTNQLAVGSSSSSSRHHNVEATSKTMRIVEDENFAANDDGSSSAAAAAALLQARRVSFPKSDHELVTGYLEPANPWEHALHTKCIPEITELYTQSCKKHNTVPLPGVIDHLQSLDLSKSVRQSCFSLKGNKLKPEDCEALEEVFKRIQYEVIDISSCQLNETAASALFDMIEYYEAANELDISENPEMTSRGWVSCISLIRRSRALQILHAQGNPLSEANTINLGKSMLQSCLHTIKLEHCGLMGNPMYHLCMGLRRNTSIKELWLAHNDLSQKDADNIADLIKANAYLQFLDVSNNDIRDAGLRQIVIALMHQSTRLAYLSPPSSDESTCSLTTNSTNTDIKSDTSDDSDETGKSTVMKTSVAISGRSMLHTLLKRSKEEEEKNDNNQKQHLLQKSTTIVDYEEDDDEIFARSTNLAGAEAAVVADDSTPPPQPDLIENNNPLVITENEEENRNFNSPSPSKALDVNKNSKLDDFDDTQSADSAFESASEGDISKTLSEDFARLSPFESTRIEISKPSDDDQKQTPQKQQTQPDSITTTPPAPVTTTITTPIPSARVRSHSSDSLSSENSLDGSTCSSPGGNATNNSSTGNNFSNKINEKLTKNDTLTRQKQFDVPQETTKKPNGLKAIVLWNNNLTKESGDYIADLLDTTTTLELLNIGKNIISNDFITKIQESLSNNMTLTNLGLQSAHLSCAGIKTLSSILQFGGNSTLQRIDIRDNNVQVESLNALAEALKSNKSVTQIDIDDVPKRISVGNDAQFHYTRVLHTIRSLCSSNETTLSETGPPKPTPTANPRRRGGGCYLSSRKISLTCHSVPLKKHEPTAKVETTTKKKTPTRLRSPLPSPPTISPSSSPVPSPLKSRFQVFRVQENNIGSTVSLPTTASAPDPAKEQIQKLSLSPRSRFRVVRIDDDPIVPISRSLPTTMSSPMHTPSIHHPTAVTMQPQQVANDTKIPKVDSTNSLIGNGCKLDDSGMVSEGCNDSAQCYATNLRDGESSRVAVSTLSSHFSGNREVEPPSKLDVNAQCYATHLSESGNQPPSQIADNAQCYATHLHASETSKVVVSTLTKHCIVSREVESSFKIVDNAQCYATNFNDSENRPPATHLHASEPSANALTLHNSGNSEVEPPQIDNSRVGYTQLLVENQLSTDSKLDDSGKTDDSAFIDDYLNPLGYATTKLDSGNNKDSSNFPNLVDSNSWELIRNTNQPSKLSDIAISKVMKCGYPSKEHYYCPSTTETDSNNEKTLTRSIQISPLKENQRNLIQFDDDDSPSSTTTPAAMPTQRQRKTSWISNPTCPTTVDKLLSLFQHPGNILRRSPEASIADDPLQPLQPQPMVAAVQTTSLAIRKQSPPSSLFPWMGTEAETQASSFLDAATKQFRDIADFGKQVFRQNIAFGNETTTTAIGGGVAATTCDCDAIPSDVKLEIKENISPEHTITEGILVNMQKQQQPLPSTTGAEFIVEQNPLNAATVVSSEQEI